MRVPPGAVYTREMFSIFDVLSEVPEVVVVDVGAMWLGEEHLPYKPLLVPKARTRVVGFEPLPEECAKLNGLKLPNHTFLPYFIGDGSDRTFHITSAPMTSSLYEPNIPLLRRFQQLEELTTTKAKEKVSTRRLDDLDAVGRCDFLKIDVQGAELDVLKGSTRVLSGASVVFCEVEFVRMYRDQPLFADVDAFMRSQGWTLHQIRPPSSRMLKPLMANKNPTSPGSQIIWSDAIFIPDFMKFDEMDPDRLLRIAVILHELYKSVDMVSYALLRRAERVNDGLWEAYMTKLIGRVPAKPVY